MRQGLFQLGCFFLAIGLSVNAVAQDHDNESLLPGFKFQKNESLLTPRMSSTLDSSTDSKPVYRLTSPETKSSSYDAILYYPLHRQGVSFDLGLNLRLQEDQSTTTAQPSPTSRDWLSIDPTETRTLLHAAAVFDLPFNGLKAGVSGTYNPDLTNTEYDYQAKLSYKWKSGFGLEGGWQHQQKSNDPLGLNLNDGFDAQTLFLDMNYRF